MIFYQTSKLHHSPSGATHLARLFVHDYLKDCGKTDKDIDDHCECGACAKYHFYKIVVESDKKPIEAANHEQDKRYHVSDFHDFILEKRLIDNIDP